MMDSLGLIVDGYDDDPREIYAIQEVRRFYQQLWERWPYWLYFCNLDTENLMMMVMCCLGSLDALKVQGQEEVKVICDPLEVAQFISKRHPGCRLRSCSVKGEGGSVHLDPFYLAGRHNPKLRTLLLIG